MGRTLSFFTTGTAVMSSVKRVDVSNVRIPRSQRMTFVLPCIVMYSLAASHSSIVAAMPRLNSTALPESAVAAPIFLSSEKFGGVNRDHVVPLLHPHPGKIGVQPIKATGHPGGDVR